MLKRTKSIIKQQNIILIILYFLVSFTDINAQIGIGTNSPNTSSVLELKSTEKGFLPPRMTSSQRDVIASPTEGLIIYNYNSKCLQIFNSNHWFDMCTGNEIIKPLSAEVNEGGTINLQAPQGYVFNEVLFASYGTPTGNNGNYQLGSCHATNSKSIVENLALGNNSLTINASNGVFGDPCGGTFKRLYILINYISIN